MTKKKVTAKQDHKYLVPFMVAITIMLSSVGIIGILSVKSDLNRFLSDIAMSDPEMVVTIDAPEVRND